jgi:hypothetical protein
MLASVLDIKTPSAPPRLTNVFSFMADTSISPIRLATVPTPTGALLLMCSPTRPTGSLALFHPSYPAVIDARDTPRSLTTVREIIMLGPRIAGLSCRIASTTAGEAAQDKDAVYLVDVNVPAGGVGIAQLLSSADLTARYITSTAPETEDPTPSANTVAARDRAFLDSFAKALKTDAAAATEIFNAYEIAEGDPFALRTKKLMKIREQESSAVKARSTAKLAGQVVKLVLESALGASDSTAGELKAGEDVEMVAETGPRGAYPHAIVRSLIRREWVSDGMWARGGVIRALLALGDWVSRGYGIRDVRMDTDTPQESIMLALPRLAAIPSTSLVAVVHAALHPTPTSTGSTAPPLTTVLESYLSAPCSAPLHRRAIHTGLNGTDDAARVLTVFADWLEAFRERGEMGSGWGIDAVTGGWGEEERKVQVGQVVAVGKDVSLASVRLP